MAEVPRQPQQRHQRLVAQVLERAPAAGLAEGPRLEQRLLLVVRLPPHEAEEPELVLAYLHRLSDLLFTLARLANHREGVGDVTW